MRCLHLFEQADIADGDHRLVGEGLQQVDLLVAEGMHFRAAKRRLSPMLSPSRSSGTLKNGAVAHAARHFPAIWEFIAFRRLQVVHVHGSLINEGPPAVQFRLIGHFCRVIGIGP